MAPRAPQMPAPDLAPPPQRAPRHIRGFDRTAPERNRQRNLRQRAGTRREGGWGPAWRPHARRCAWWSACGCLERGMRGLIYSGLHGSARKSRDRWWVPRAVDGGGVGAPLSARAPRAPPCRRAHGGHRRRRRRHRLRRPSSPAAPGAPRASARGSCSRGQCPAGRRPLGGWRGGHAWGAAREATRWVAGRRRRSVPAAPGVHTAPPPMRLLPHAPYSTL
jgi:hypothetical protein